LFLSSVAKQSRHGASFFTPQNQCDATLVPHRHLHDRGSRIVAGVLLQQVLNFSDPTLRFFSVDLARFMFTGNFVKKVFKEGFHGSSPLQGLLVEEDGKEP
jgi:hypothetical protein